jgi:hypothetical protein
MLTNNREAITLIQHTGRWVQRLATGWTTDGSEFESQYVQEFSLLHVVQIGSGVDPTSYPMGTGVLSPGKN